MNLESESSYDNYRRGRDLMGSGDLAGAIECLRRSSEIDPHHKTLELIGECLMRTGRNIEAIIPLAASSTLNVGPRAPSLLAEAYLALGKMHDAKAMAEMALSRDANCKRAKIVLETAAQA